MKIYLSILKKSFLSALVLVFVACSALEKDRSQSQELKRLRSEYYAYLNKTCIKDEVYDGLRNAFHYVVCPLDEKILSYQLELNKIYFLWDDEAYSEKKRELEAKQAKETQAFLSFYTPDGKLNDLSTKNSNWRAFFDHNGRRHLATIEKNNNRYEDLRAIYPAHSQWSTGYTLTFQVPLHQIDLAATHFTITGRVGFSRKSLAR